MDQSQHEIDEQEVRTVAKSRNHKDLIVWQKARRLVSTLYQVTATFPTTEQYGLVSQSRRAGISILSNISEGAARGGDKEFRHFLYVARGSVAELEAQLIVATDLGFIAGDQPLLADAAEVGRLINGLIAVTKHPVNSG